MNRLIMCLHVVFGLVYASVYSQSPQAFNYQGVARDSDGTELASESISIRTSIRSSSSSGLIEYQEEHVVVTNSFGLFSIAIGRGTASIGVFEGIDWGSGTKWLQIEMDTSGGSNYVNMGSSQFLSTPYALYAENAGGATGIWNQEGDVISYNLGNVGIGTALPSEPLSVAGIIESTTGGIKFPDGTVQTTAALEENFLWKENGSFTIEPALSKNIRIQADSIELGLNDAVLVGIKKSNATLEATGVIGCPITCLNNLDYSYDSNKRGPYVEFSNYAAQSNPSSSMGIMISTLDAVASGGSAGNVILNNINRGVNAADFVIQCEYDGSGATDYNEVARFTSEGSVGFGTGTPKEKLHVSGGNIYLDDPSNGVIMSSPNGSCWLLQVNDSGNAVFTTVPCP